MPITAPKTGTRAVGQPAQQFVATVMMEYRFADHRPKAGSFGRRPTWEAVRHLLAVPALSAISQTFP
jgi:hypothetical protein